MSGAEMIAAERQRQIDVEGWTPDHDAEHGDGELAEAAATYIVHRFDLKVLGEQPSGWPWDGHWNPDADPLRNLVKAGALVAAEIDRILRLRGES